VEGGNPRNVKEKNTRSQIEKVGGREKNEKAIIHIIMVSQFILTHLRKPSKR
jgi:hypothetical protein